LADGALRDRGCELVQVVAQPWTHGLHDTDRGTEALAVGPDRVALTALELARNRLKLALQSARLVTREQAATAAAGSYQRDREASSAGEECTKRLAHRLPDFRGYGG
jgi:hypothetical protein